MSGMAKAIRDANAERRGIMNAVTGIQDQINSYQDESNMARTIINSAVQLIPGGPIIKGGIVAGANALYEGLFGQKHREEIKSAADDVKTAGGTGSEGQSKFFTNEREGQYSDTVQALESMEADFWEGAALDTTAAVVSGLEYKKVKGRTDPKGLLTDTEKGGYGVDIADVTEGYQYVADDASAIGSTMLGSDGITHEVDEFNIYKSPFAKSFHEGKLSEFAKKFGKSDWDQDVDDWFGGSITGRRKSE